MKARADRLDAIAQIEASHAVLMDSDGDLRQEEATPEEVREEAGEELGG